MHRHILFRHVLAGSRKVLAPLLAAVLLTTLGASPVLAAKKAPVPKDVGYLLGMYYGTGTAFLIRENKGRLEMVYRFSDTDRDFSGGNIFPLAKVHFDSYTLTEEGPLLSTEAPVKFDRDANGYGALCRVGGKSFNRLFFPGQDGHVFRVTLSGDYDALKTAAAGAAEPEKLKQGTAASLVNLQQAVPSVKLDLRYAAADNIFGRPLHDTAQKAYASAQVAEGLQKAAKALAARGYGLVVYEAYRPWYLSKFASDLLPGNRKGMLPLPDKGEDRNTGMTVDVGLYDLSTGTSLAMPSDFDEVSVRQYPDYPGSTTEARRLRDLLKEAMTTAGFRQGEQEWWHFVYGDISGYAQIGRAHV